MTDAPTWIAAIGTVAATGTTAVGLWMTRRDLSRIEKEQQARLVSAWYESNRIRVRNGSAKPIYRVTVQVAGVESENDDLMLKRRVREIGPGETVEFSCQLIADSEVLVFLIFHDANNVMWSGVRGKFTPLKKDTRRMRRA